MKPEYLKFVISLLLGAIIGAICIIFTLRNEIHQISIDTTDIKQMLQDADKCKE